MPHPRGDGDALAATVSELMAGTIRSVVREEMQLAVERITRSVISEKMADDASRK